MRPPRATAVHLAAAAASLGLLLSAGCRAVEAYTAALAGEERPTASIQGLRLAALSLEGVEIVAEVEIENPYDLDLPLLDVEYGLASNGARFLEGAAELPGAIPARGSRIVSLPLRVRFAELLAVAKNVRPGAVVPYTASLDLGVDAPVLGRLRLPLERSGELPVPAPPTVSLASVRFGELSLTEATAELRVDLVNTNSFPVDLSEMSYALRLGGRRIVEGALSYGGSYEPGAESRLVVPISFSPVDLGLAAWNLLQGESAAYAFEGTLGLVTPFGTLDTPFAGTGEVPFGRTPR